MTHEQQGQEAGSYPCGLCGAVLAYRPHQSASTRRRLRQRYGAQASDPALDVICDECVREVLELPPC